MEKKMYEEKREDYIALFESLGEMLSFFDDYTPERKQELDNITMTACNNAKDIPGGEVLFKIMAQYITYRYEEMLEFKSKRKQQEEKLIQALPDIFDKLAVPNENSCQDIAETIESLSSKNNYQILMEGLVAKIASL